MRKTSIFRVQVRELVENGLLAINDGYRVRNSELGPIGIPFVRGGDIGDGSINTAVIDHIRPELANRVTSKLTRPGDVAFITKATVGRVGRIRDGQPAVVFAPQVAYWRSLDESKLDSRFLFYLLKGNEFQSNLDAVKTHGSMVADYVSMSDQKLFQITLLPIEGQKRVASILGALDDKIELNRRMNETLEAMARRLFKSWFVDFDPVHAKAALRREHPKLSNADLSRRALPNMAPEIAELFPDCFEDSMLARIPHAWIPTSLGDETEFLTGVAFKSEFFLLSPPGTRLARGDNVKEGVFCWDDKSRFWPKVTPDLERYLLASGDTLIGMDGSKVGKNWVRVRSCDLPCLRVQRVARLRPNVSIGENFVWLLVSDWRFRDYVNGTKTRTSIPHISGGQIQAYQFIRPHAGDNRLFGHFEAAIAPLTRQVDKNYDQTQALTKARDTLLPRLLSGELS